MALSLCLPTASVDAMWSLRTSKLDLRSVIVAEKDDLMSVAMINMSAYVRGRLGCEDPTVILRNGL